MRQNFSSLSFLVVFCLYKVCGLLQLQENICTKPQKSKYMQNIREGHVVRRGRRNNQEFWQGGLCKQREPAIIVKKWLRLVTRAPWSNKWARRVSPFMARSQALWLIYTVPLDIASLSRSQGVEIPPFWHVHSPLLRHPVVTALSRPHGRKKAAFVCV